MATVVYEQADNERGKKKSKKRRQQKQATTVEVKQTPVGRGVFAARDFRTGDVVAEIEGEVIDDADYESDYCMELGETTSLEPAPPFRFLNHSCEPNCELFQWEEGIVDNADDRMFVAAIRPIAAGDELTIDYAWPADAAIPCRCGKPTCRGWIVDAAEIDDVVVHGINRTKWQAEQPQVKSHQQNGHRSDRATDGRGKKGRKKNGREV